MFFNDKSDFDCVCVRVQISFGQAINNEALYVCFVLSVKVCVSADY